MSGDIGDSFNDKNNDNDRNNEKSYDYSKKDNLDISKSDTNNERRTPVKSEIDITYYLSESDFDENDKYCLSEKKYVVKKKKLPPIGVFWDIENCRIPKGRSAVTVSQLIRDIFFTGYREAEFVVVCDVKKESNELVQELHDAQVSSNFKKIKNLSFNIIIHFLGNSYSCAIDIQERS